MSESSGKLLLRGIGLTCAALIFYLAFKFATAATPIDEDARMFIVDILQTEYRVFLVNQKDLHHEIKAEIHYAISDLKIGATSARGSEQNMVIRVQVEPNAGTPPGTPLTRYLRMRHSPITGWHYEGEADKIDYYLSIF